MVAASHCLFRTAVCTTGGCPGACCSQAGLCCRFSSIARSSHSVFATHLPYPILLCAEHRAAASPAPTPARTRVIRHCLHRNNCRHGITTKTLGLNVQRTQVALFGHTHQAAKNPGVGAFHQKANQRRLLTPADREGSAATAAADNPGAAKCKCPE